MCYLFDVSHLPGSRCHTLERARQAAREGTGFLVKRVLDEHPSRYVLLWLKDDVVYAVSGPGTPGGGRGCCEQLGIR